ncbi:hypothetical protein [Nitratidesulfovibrio termitidis]|uniref:hypothetical protein n=1 Tax=Nitratidesulfovibrio termitidis TaxID=42252 RepID=UPI0003F635C4|nr:hypothetical protein [Nitratidesulfovibrio termitidis]
MSARNRIISPVLRPLLATVIALSVLSGLSVLTGCAGPSKDSPISEWTFTQGEAFRAQRDAQRLNPGPADDDPVIGLDGRVGERVMKNMREGEKKTDESNTLRLKIGSK